MLIGREYLFLAKKKRRKLKVCSLILYNPNRNMLCHGLLNKPAPTMHLFWLMKKQ